MTCPIEKCPCAGCGERSPTCHGGCERYKAWKYKRSEIMLKVHAERRSYTNHDAQPFWRKYRKGKKQVTGVER